MISKTQSRVLYDNFFCRFVGVLDGLGSSRRLVPLQRRGDELWPTHPGDSFTVYGKLSSRYHHLMFLILLRFLVSRN